MYGAVGKNVEIEVVAAAEPQQQAPVEEKKSRPLLFSALVAVGLAALMFGAAYQSGQLQMYKPTLKATGLSVSLPETKSYLTADELYVTATNEYGKFSAPYPWLEEVAGSQLVEPYKTTTLTLTGSLAEDSSNKFVWVVDGFDNQETTTPSVDMVFTTIGNYNIHVHVYSSEGAYQGTYKTLLINKYVKRELRTLTVEDREKFLDAAAEIWKHTDDEGKALYGEKFTSIATFVAEHSQASNDIMCDTYHEGTGFLPHHLALQVSFEAALRAIDPAVTLPYWDFTIEGQTIYDAGKPPSYMMEITPVFSDTWFGAVDEDSHIINSRWAHSTIPVAPTEETTQNSYGFIRSYWNNNNDPEVARHMFDACGLEPEHKAVPYCKTHYDILNAKDLATFKLLSPGDGHGPLHVQFGGVWGGCTDAYNSFVAKWGDFMDETLSEDEVEAVGLDSRQFMNKWGKTSQRRTMFNKAVMGEYFHIYRSFWRSHMCAVDNTPALLECPEECDVENTPFEECTCSVNKLTNAETNWENLFPCVLNSADNREFFNKTMPSEMLEDMTTFLATSSVLEGEMIESASPADIMFWIIHPVIERLLSAKRLPGVTKMGQTEFYKWADVDGSEETWLTYSYYNIAEGENLWHPEAYTCEGHGPDDKVLADRLPFTEQVANVADFNGDGVISNWEMYLAIDPNLRDGNDYVFDNFNWDHCDDMVVKEKK